MVLSSVVAKLIYPAAASVVVMAMSAISVVSLSYAGLMEVKGKSMLYSKLKDEKSKGKAKVGGKVGMIAAYTPAFLAGAFSLFIFPSGDLRFTLLRSAITTHFFKRLFEGGVNKVNPEKLQKLGKERADGKESGEIYQEGLSIGTCKWGIRAQVSESGQFSNLLKSPECSRGRSRSRSRSIVREASADDPYYREGKHRSVSDDERAGRDSKGYRHSSRDIREKERERSSSSRYTERVEKHYSREDQDTYRDGSRERF